MPFAYATPAPYFQTLFAPGGSANQATAAPTATPGWLLTRTAVPGPNFNSLPLGAGDNTGKLTNGVEMWRYTGRIGTRVTMRVQASWEAALIVVSPSGSWLSSSDSITFTVNQAEPYLISVRNAANPDGVYILNVQAEADE